VDDLKKYLSFHWVLISLGLSVTGLLLPLYMNHAGIDETQIGNIFFFGTILSAFLLVLFFLHSDVSGRKLSLLVFALLGTLASALAAFSPPIFFVFLLIALFLRAEGRAVWVLTKIFAIENYEHSKGLSYGFFAATLTLGGIVGTVASGYLADSVGFQQTFFFAALISVLSFIPIFFIKEHKIKLQKFSFRPKFTKTFTALTLHRFLASLGSAIPFIFAYVIFMNTRLHFSYSVIGLISALSGIGAILGSMAGKLSDEYDFRTISILATLLSVVPVVFLPFIADIFLIIFIMFMSSVGDGIYGTTLPYFFEKTSTQLGRDVSVIETMGISTGAAIGSWLSGVLIVNFGYVSVFIVGTVIGLLSILPLFVFYKK